MTKNVILQERRRRFVELLKRYKGQSEAADALGFGSAAAVSNYKLRKNMGEDVARRIESLADLPSGTFLEPDKVPWPYPLDQCPVKANPTINRNNDQYRKGGTYDVSKHGEYIPVQSFEFWSGAVQKEIREMYIPSAWLDEKGFSSTDVVSIVVPDDAQGPRILKGDYACIATVYGSAPRNNTLYAVMLGGEHTLRLINYQHNGDIKLCCLNDDYSYAEQLIQRNEICALDILGEYAGAMIKS